MVIRYGDRSNVLVIEPLLTDQWFVDEPTLAKGSHPCGRRR